LDVSALIGGAVCASVANEHKQTRAPAKAAVMPATIRTCMN
jgi:hypothetical protein